MISNKFKCTISDHRFTMLCLCGVLVAFEVACSRLSDSGGRAKSVGASKEKTRIGAEEGAPPSLLSTRFSLLAPTFFAPHYLRAWNRLRLRTLETEAN